MAGFKNFNNSDAEVYRDGVTKKIPPTFLVVGDVLILNSGCKIAADLRVFQGSGLAVDNSSLTGEPLPIKLSTKCGAKGMDDPKEAKNIAFFSTLCKDGVGTGVIIRTGTNTFMGKIADLAQSAETTETTLQIELDQLIKFLAVVAILFGVIFFCLGFLITPDWLNNLINAIGLIVANVPEGLLGAITLALTITAEKMFSFNVLVKNLASVETLGALTCICSDKTGTLTQNKMTVKHFWYDMKFLNAEESMSEEIDTGIEKFKTEYYKKKGSPSLSFNLFQIIGICGSNAKFIYEVKEDYKPVRDERNRYMALNPGLEDKAIGDYVKNNILPKYRDEYRQFMELNIDEAETSNCNY